MQRIMLLRSRSAIVCYQQLTYSPVAHRKNAAHAARDGSLRMTLASRVLPLALGLLAIARPHEAHAQSPRRELVGKILDSLGAPIEGALVQVPGAAARTDYRGTFQLWTSDSDTITL